MTEGKRGILVGFDGSGSSWQATWWAVDEARQHQSRLIVAHVAETDVNLAWGYWLDPAIQDRGDPNKQPQRLLDEAASRVQERAPDLEVTPLLVQDAPARGLIALSADAQCVVVGHRGIAGLSKIFAGSVAVRLAAHAHCPVVVTRGTHLPTDRGNRIVVGTDGSAAADAAIGFAVAEASVRKARLTLIHAWTDPWEQYGAPLVPAGQVDEIQQRAQAALEEAAQGWRNKAPNVEIDIELRSGSPGQVLVQESAAADLTVVGSHGRGAFTGMLFGSVSQAVLNMAESPVAVVRPNV